MSEPLYLLDTDVLSQPARRHCPPEVIRQMEAHEGQMAATSINIGEIVFGANKVAGGKRYLEYLEDVVLPRIPVLPFALPEARIYGELRATLETAGTRLADMDLLIASVALANDLILVTGNVRHMAGVPNLTVENWLQE